MDLIPSSSSVASHTSGPEQASAPKEPSLERIQGIVQHVLKSDNIVREDHLVRIPSSLPEGNYERTKKLKTQMERGIQQAIESGRAFEHIHESFPSREVAIDTFQHQRALFQDLHHRSEVFGIMGLPTQKLVQDSERALTFISCHHQDNREIKIERKVALTPHEDGKLRTRITEMEFSVPTRARHEDIAAVRTLWG